MSLYIIMRDACDLGIHGIYFLYNYILYIELSSMFITEGLLLYIIVKYIESGEDQWVKTAHQTW